MKKTIFLVVVLISISLTGCVGNIQYDIDNSNIVDNAQIETEKMDIENEVYHFVPFADQAPFKDWSDPYQEACEETCLIMAKAYLDNNQQVDLGKDYINQQILDLVDWQQANWQGHFDLSAKQTLNLFNEFYNNNMGQVVAIDSINDIKQILSQDKIIITPTYGKKLDNNHFTPPGPVYHMLLIKGYNENNFITNDPGIWQGKDFEYSFENLFESIGDLPDEASLKHGYIKQHEELMLNSQKKIIVF